MSMAARRELMKKRAVEYAKAPKMTKDAMLDLVIATADCSRANARRTLTIAGKGKGSAMAVKHTPRNLE